MTPVAALQEGMDVVEALSNGATPGSAVDRTHAALAVAEFLLGYGDGGDDGDDDDEGEPKPDPDPSASALTPAQARQLAASLLDAADDAEGTPNGLGPLVGLGGLL